MTDTLDDASETLVDSNKGDAMLLHREEVDGLLVYWVCANSL